MHDERLSKSDQPLDQAFQVKANISEKKPYKFQQGKKGRAFQKKGKWQGNKNEDKAGDEQQQSRSYQHQCRICKRTNHETKECRFKYKRCKIANHSYRDCWYKDKSKKEVKFTKEENDQLFSCMSIQQASQNIWYVDSGCSSHMTRDKKKYI